MMIINVANRNNTYRNFFIENETGVDREGYAAVALQARTLETGKYENSSSQNSKEKYQSVILNNLGEKVSINKNKIQQYLNPYKENNLPDWVYTKAKEALGVSNTTSLKSNKLVVSDSNTFKNTQLAWLSMMIVGNAIAMSDGQSDMKIDEAKVDWNQVFEITKKGFQNNMQQEHINEEADKYMRYLNSPNSLYYFYSDEQKKSMSEEFKNNNYSLNSICFDALSDLIKNYKS